MGLGKKYLYVVFTLALVLLLQGLGHHTPLAATSQKPPTLRFAIIGDTGTGDNKENEVARQLAASRSAFPFEFVIMLGDNMYGGASAKDFGSKFEKPYESLLSSGIPFYASLGNHDIPDREIVYKGFNMAGRRYYTFKPREDVQFFALDSNYMDKRQLTWLEEELKKSGSAWKICFFHHPLYSSGEKHGPSLELRRVLEPLLTKYSVDIVWSGHEHIYERIKPQKGVQYFIVGSSAKLTKGGIDSKSGITAAGFDTDNAFMLAEITQDGMSFKTISRAGALVDSGIVQRARKGSRTE